MENIFKSIKENPLPYFIQIVSIVAIIIALYVTSRLAPLVEDLRALDIRVQATEKFQVPSSDFYALKQNVKDINDRTNRIEGKLDRILGL